MLSKAILVLLSGILFLSEIRAQDATVAEPTEMMIWNITNFSPLDVVIDIQMRLFFQADKKIEKIGTSSPGIARIVKVTYGNNNEKFDLLNDYGNLTAHIPTSCIVLTTLWQEMMRNGHMDVHNLMALDDTLNRKVIRKEGASDDTRAKAVSVSKEIRGAIVENSARIISAGILNGSFPYSNRLQVLASALETFDEQISDDTIRKVIDDVYDHVTTTQLIRFVYSNQRIPQTATALVRIFYKLEFEKSQDFYSVVILFLGDYLKRLTDVMETANISDGKRNMIIFVVSRLPTSVRNLYFSSKLCIRNVRYSEYLYSPNNSFVSTENTRYVFTSGISKNDSHGHWTINKFNDPELSFQLLSEYNANELLFVPDVPDTQLNKDGLTRVMTRMPDSSLKKKSAWIFEVIANEVFIVNSHYDSILCVNDDKYQNINRLVYTIDRPRYTNNLWNCIWALESC